MPRIQIIIEDHVVPQLLTSAIEAYEIQHKAHNKGKANHRLETYGLLWGYALPARGDVPVRLVAVLATVETSALRKQDSVQPDSDSLLMKRDFFREYWPQLELIGTFHSHPYDNLTEVNQNKGWRGSGKKNGKGDFAYWPAFHKDVCSDIDELAHLVITIAELGRKGTACPERLSGNEYFTGFVLTAGTRKLWIKGYCTEKVMPVFDKHGVDSGDLRTQNNNISYQVQEDVFLGIPTVEQRFSSKILRE